MKFFTTTALLATLFSLTALAKQGPVTVAYVEVNDNALANVGRYTLDDGSPVFDLAIIFAGNINYDGKPVVYNNPQVQATLDNAQTQIKPLQAKGTKVLLSILGNHQQAGISNFQSYASAQDFAAQVLAVVNEYDLDGVDLDDEWVTYGSGSTPAATQQSIAWIITALREALGTKLLTFYHYGPAASLLESSPSDIGSKIDYTWNGIYGSYDAPSVPGIGKDGTSAAAIQIGSTSTDTAASFAQRTITDGYGVYMTYALDGADRSSYISSFTQPLYGQNAHFS